MRHQRWTMNEKLPEFQQMQHAFAAYLRDPEGFPVPEGIPANRGNIYRDLLYNNIESFIAAGFPVLKSLLSQETWARMIRNFYATHRCQSPLFTDISKEFLDYLQRSHQPESHPPFILELAHYEWIELALSVAEPEPPECQENSDFQWLEAHVQLSPVALPLAYRYPVHTIGPSHQPAEAPASPTFLVVYRNREDQIKFMEATPVVYRLLELLTSCPDLSLGQLLHQIADELRLPANEAFVTAGFEMVAMLNRKGVLGLRD
jgi:hypothetical protein